MKRIRIIDLLNKIANGESMPEDIEFKGESFWYYGVDCNYYSEKDFDRCLFDDLYNTVSILNEEVEVYE